MKTILVPTDFSKTASNAALYAAHLAKDMNAKLILLHAYHVPAIASEVPVEIITADELQEENENYLKDEAARLKKETGVEVTYLAKMGFATDEILAEEKNANLIVMGIHGAGKISEALMGSIATATLRKAKIPVIIVPENATYKKPKKIVFACDYDPKIGSNTLNGLKYIAKTFDSKVYFVNVKQKTASFVEEGVIASNLESQLKNVEHIYPFPEKEDLVESINAFVKEHQADMVAVIPHHYDIMERLFHKSISKKMAFHTHVPLLGLPDLHQATANYFI